jgi:hypothetical protein
MAMPLGVMFDIELNRARHQNTMTRKRISDRYHQPVACSPP